MQKYIKALGLTAALADPQMATSADLEVTHWWTSGGEAAAVKAFADAFNATGHNWVDGAIAGSGGTCLLYTSPSPRDKRQSRMPSSA